MEVKEFIRKKHLNNMPTRYFVFIAFIIKRYHPLTSFKPFHLLLTHQT